MRQRNLKDTCAKILQRFGNISLYRFHCYCVLSWIGHVRFFLGKSRVEFIFPVYINSENGRASSAATVKAVRQID